MATGQADSERRAAERGDKASRALAPERALAPGIVYNLGQPMVRRLRMATRGRVWRGSADIFELECRIKIRRQSKYERINMSLQDEIDTRRKEIHTDSYPMSIGELINLHRDGELDIHPEFQRFFRWTNQQKSRWIESILLGIPLPSVFVAQREDGVWDVIDGLQRLSTILQLVGDLKKESGERWEPLVLDKTKYLPSLEGKYWEHKDRGKSLTSDQQRFIKRAKLDIKIILRESHESSKYELFQRLNTGGSSLSDQELRNCMLLMVGRNFYKWLAELTSDENFQKCMPITDRAKEERYDMELALRFVVFRSLPESQLSKITELGEFLTDEAVRLAQDKEFDYDREARAFRLTFDILAATLEDDSFRRYETTRDRFSGGFLISAYEVVAFGLGYHFVDYDPATDAERVASKVKEQVWKEPAFLTSSGVRATQRLPKTIAFGRQVFEK